jgi:hypothetical protein
VTDRRLQPPGGEPPPASVPLGSGEPLDLASLAEDICRSYQREFPDEQEQYGDAGTAWCVHDNQYLLFWAAEAADGYLDMRREVSWLASVLEARDFPLDRLARDLEIGAQVVRERLLAEQAEPLAAVLLDAAGYVRSRDTFLA